VLGADHPDTIISVNNLAVCIDRQGRSVEAEPIFRQALEARTRVLGADHPSTIASVHNLASCIDSQGRQQKSK
jgi:Flp pilus assembly protein TadD